MPFDFMAVVTVHSDFGAQGNKSATVVTFYLSTCHEVIETDVMILVFEMLF